jgi:hypothetical protein
MNLSDVELPSNRKFGFFFAAVFWIAATYSYYANKTEWLCIFGAIGLVFFIATIVKADALLHLNKLWMRFGLLLGIIVSPILMGIIFFGLFTPIAIFMRLFGRDELHLHFYKRKTYWVTRETTAAHESFKNQF